MRYNEFREEFKLYTVSSGNIFRDLGFADAEEKMAKAKLASIINKIIQDRGLTQKKAGKMLGIKQPKVSALKNGRLKGFSMERLFSFLEALPCFNQRKPRNLHNLRYRN